MSKHVLDDQPPRESATHALRPNNRSDAKLDEPTFCARPSSEGHGKSAAPSVPGYEILEELGRGGMGVVYKAWQYSLRRTVALKMVLAGSFARADDLERFRAEAMAVARLHHPHLLSIYEIGDAEHTPFYAMEYMEGGNLARRLNGQPVAPRTAAKLVQALADAMEYAHKNGIVHRDLKPANILLAGKDETPIDDCIAKITDFGVAKHLYEPSSCTRTGDILGTPHYMAPEQATGVSGKVTPASDVYSLGAILYELLTGRAPFHGFEGAAVLLRVAHEDPDPLGQIVRSVPRDLQTICMKAMEKDPARRYASAGALADDLGRYLRHEPIQAAPAALAYRVGKWVRRRPGWAATLALLLTFAIFGLSVMTIMWRQTMERAEQQSLLLGMARDHAADQSRLVNDWKGLLADSYLERGIHLSEKGDTSRGLHLMVRALEIAEEIERTERKPNPLVPAIRMNLTAWGQSVGTPPHLLMHRDWVWDMAFSPDGKYVLSASKDTTLKAWDTATGAMIGAALKHPYPIWAVAFHPDGKSLFTLCASFDEKAQGELRAWTPDPVQPGRFTPRGAPMKFDCLAFFMRVNATGDRLWVGAYDTGKSVLFSFDGDSAGNGLRIVAKLDGAHTEAVFSPDGQVLATVEGTLNEPTPRVHLWNARTGVQLGAPIQQPGAARALLFSKDNRHLIVGSATDVDVKHGETSRLHVWDWAKRKQVAVTQPLYGQIKRLALAPNGQMFAASLFSFVHSASEPNKMIVTDGHIDLWQLDDDGRIESFGQPLHIGNTVWAMQFSPDSRLLLAGSRNFGAYLFSIANGERLLPIVWHEGNCMQVAFRPDGRQVVTASAGGHNGAAARLWDVPSFAHIAPPLLQPHVCRSIFWERDGSHVWVSAGPVLSRWDPKRGARGESIDLPRTAVYAFPTVKEGRFLLQFDDYLHEAVRGSKAIVQLPELAKPVRGGPHYDTQVPHDIIFQRWPGLNRFQLLNGAGKAISPVIADDDHDSTAAALSRDGRFVAMAVNKPAKPGRLEGGYAVRLYQAHDLALIREYPMKARVLNLAFSPEGEHLALARNDRQVQFLNLATHQLESAPLLHERNIMWVAYTGNHDLLLSASEKGRVLVWHVPTGKRIGPAFEHGRDLVAMCLHPEGKYLATGTNGRMAMTWHIPEPAQGSLEDLRIWVEAMTGMEMRDRDSIAPLDAERIRANQQKLELTHPTY